MVLLPCLLSLKEIPPTQIHVWDHAKLIRIYRCGKLAGKQCADGSSPVSPKHDGNENNRNHHNDEQRDDALREIRIFRHCLVPLKGIRACR